MGLLGQYFMNGATFAEATSLYTDSTLVTYAADGFYSSDGISRPLVGGVLGAQSSCSECLLTCGGETILNLDAGSGTWNTTYKATDAVGAVLIQLIVGTEAVGFKCEYNGVTYNTISSEAEGLLHNSANTGYTYIGESGGVYGVTGVTLPQYDYENGDYVQNSSVVVNQAAIGDERTANNPSISWILIPKFSTTNDEITIDAEAITNQENNFAVRVLCPQLLSKFTSSTLETNTGDACVLAVDQERYHYPVNGEASFIEGGYGVVGLYDFVSSDPYGAIPLPNGHYRIASNKSMEVESGVVINIIDCD